MFEIGFWEVSLVLFVALLVLGPKHLPTVAKTAGKMLARWRNIVKHMQTEVQEITETPAEKTIDQQTKQPHE